MVGAPFTFDRLLLVNPKSPSSLRATLYSAHEQRLLFMNILLGRINKVLLLVIYIRNYDRIIMIIVHEAHINLLYVDYILILTVRKLCDAPVCEFRLHPSLSQLLLD